MPNTERDWEPLTPLGDCPKGCRVRYPRGGRSGTVYREEFMDGPHSGVMWDDAPGRVVAYPDNWLMEVLKV